MSRSLNTTPRRANQVRRESANRARTSNNLRHGRWDDVETSAPTRRFRTGVEVD